MDADDNAPRNGNEELARRSIQAVWNDGHLGLIEELFVEGFVQHHTASGPDIADRTEYRSFIQALRTAMPDLTTTIFTTVADGDEVVVHFAISGTHTGGEMRGIEPTDRRLEWEGMILYRFRDGWISEAWIQYDELGLLSQLEIVSPPEPADTVEP